MNLLIDLGNTRFKWAWSDARGRHPGGAIAHADPRAPEQLLAALADTPRPTALWLAAVGSIELADLLQQRLAGLWPDLRQHRLLTPSEGCGVRVAYHEPARMGVDRFLALVALRERAEAVLSVGVGTALALDAMDADGQHLGGLIAPTAVPMRDAVLATTARVAWRAQPELVELGRGTEEALWSGCWQALAGLVERVHDRLGDTHGSPPKIVLHGGDAPVLADLLRRPCETRPELVLDGLARYAALMSGTTARA